MKFFHVFLLISCLPTISSARSAAASVSSRSSELELKSRSSAPSVIAIANPEFNQGHIHVLVKSGDLAQLHKAVATEKIRLNSQSGIHALHAAMMFNVRPMFDYLLEQGVDVNGASAQFGTPLHHAAMLPNKEQGAYFTKALLEKQADCNIPYKAPVPMNKEGGTIDPLHPNEDGYLAIQLAARYGNIVAVRLLVEFGAQYEFRHNGLTKLFAAHVDNRRNEQSIYPQIQTVTVQNAVEAGEQGKKLRAANQRRTGQPCPATFNLENEFPPQSSGFCSVM